MLIALDGTWCDGKLRGRYGVNTNVVEIYTRYKGASHILSGIGAVHNIVGKLLGGAFGVGGKARVRQALRLIMDDHGEQVDIVGFSRGAALAVHLVNVLDDYDIPVRFLGLFDTVAAFGVPLDIGPVPFNRWNLGYRLMLPENVAACYHALALHEARPAFRPTKMSRAYEVWFSGVHGDIGGSTGNKALSNIPLRWMLHQMREAGCPVDCCASIPFNHMSAITTQGGQEPRTIRTSDRLHWTALSPGHGPLVEYAPERRR